MFCYLDQTAASPVISALPATNVTHQLHALIKLEAAEASGLTAMHIKTAALLCLLFVPLATSNASQGARDAAEAVTAGDTLAAIQMQEASSALREVQHALNELGYKAGPEDGILGPATRAAIRAFDRDHGMEAYGGKYSVNPFHLELVRRRAERQLVRRRAERQRPLAMTGEELTDAHAQTVQEIAKEALGSTVLLVMEDASGQPLSLGSGFFVGEGLIASNLHVIEGAASGYAKLVGQRARYDIEGTVAVDPEMDLAILKISGASAAPFTLGSSGTVQVGDLIYAVGNPLGLEGTFSQGIVSSIRKISGDKLLQITAPISPGSSGGPVMNSKGDVIGVSVATYRAGQNLNFAIPSVYLTALLKQTGLTVPLAWEPIKTQTSILSDLGGHSVEGVIGGTFTWDNRFYNFGNYTITLRNQRRQPVRNIYCLVIFYDLGGTPLDANLLHYRGIIRPGLGKRIKGKVDASVKRLTTPPSGINPYISSSSLVPATKVEFRILNFEVVQ